MLDEPRPEETQLSVAERGVKAFGVLLVAVGFAAYVVAAGLLRLPVPIAAPIAIAVGGAAAWFGAQVRLIRSITDF